MISKDEKKIIDHIMRTLHQENKTSWTDDEFFDILKSFDRDESNRIYIILTQRLQLVNAEYPFNGSSYFSLTQRGKDFITFKEQRSKSFRESVVKYWLPLVALLFSILTFLWNISQQSSSTELEKRIEILEDSLNLSETKEAPLHQEIDSIPKNPEGQQIQDIKEK